MEIAKNIVKKKQNILLDFQPMASYHLIIAEERKNFVLNNCVSFV